MPHIILEHSANLEISSYNSIFSDIHSILEQYVSANPKNCRSRARVASHYYVGNGEQENKFLHLDINLLSGRTDDAKKECGRILLDKLKTVFTDTKLQITVKLSDTPKEFYFK